MKKALITGVTGQDGSYLSEFLIEKGYDVHGIIRRSSVDYRERIAHLEGNPHFHLHYGDMGDSMSLVAVIGSVRPDEFITWRPRAMCRSALMFRSSRPMWMLPACCACWKPCACAGWRIPAGCTRLRPRSCTARWRKCPRTKNAVPSVQPLCGGQTVRFLDHQGVP